MFNKMALDGTNRILVLGCSGSGKSTLTRQIAKSLQLPAIHLDIYYWNPGWVETPRDKWREKVETLIKDDRWVMDGTFADTFDLRFPLADRIVFIDLPTPICLYRAVKRVFMYNKSKRRPDMADGCHEAFDLQFYRYILSYRKKVHPLIFAALEQYQCSRNLIHLSSVAEVNQFSSRLPLCTCRELKRTEK